METRQQRRDRFEAEKTEQDQIRKEMQSMVRKVRSDITASGLNSVQYKLEHAEKTRSDPKLIEAYKRGIEQYKEYLKKSK